MIGWSDELWAQVVKEGVAAAKKVFGTGMENEQQWETLVAAVVLTAMARNTAFQLEQHEAQLKEMLNAETDTAKAVLSRQAPMRVDPEALAERNKEGA